MHKADVDVLIVLMKNKCTSAVKSYTIAQIYDTLKATKSSISYSTIHSILQGLCVANLVQKGLKRARADCYFITRAGLEKVSELLGTEDTNA